MYFYFDPLSHFSIRIFSILPDFMFSLLYFELLWFRWKTPKVVWRLKFTWCFFGHMILKEMHHFRKSFLNKNHQPHFLGNFFSKKMNIIIWVDNSWKMKEGEGDSNILKASFRFFLRFWCNFLIFLRFFRFFINAYEFFECIAPRLLSGFYAYEWVNESKFWKIKHFAVINF